MWWWIGMGGGWVRRVGRHWHNSEIVADWGTFSVPILLGLQGALDWSDLWTLWLSSSRMQSPPLIRTAPFFFFRADHLIHSRWPLGWP